MLRNECARAVHLLENPKCFHNATSGAPPIVRLFETRNLKYARLPINYPEVPCNEPIIYDRMLDRTYVPNTAAVTDSYWMSVIKRRPHERPRRVAPVPQIRHVPNHGQFLVQNRQMIIPTCLEFLYSPNEHACVNQATNVGHLPTAPYVPQQLLLPLMDPPPSQPPQSATPKPFALIRDTSDDSDEERYEWAENKYAEMLARKSLQAGGSSRAAVTSSDIKEDATSSRPSDSKKHSIYSCSSNGSIEREWYPSLLASYPACDEQKKDNSPHVSVSFEHESKEKLTELLHTVPVVKPLLGPGSNTKKHGLKVNALRHVKSGQRIAEDSGFKEVFYDVRQDDASNRRCSYENCKDVEGDNEGVRNDADRFCGAESGTATPTTEQFRPEATTEKILQELSKMRNLQESTPSNLKVQPKFKKKGGKRRVKVYNPRPSKSPTPPGWAMESLMTWNGKEEVAQTHMHWNALLEAVQSA
eukprot:Platyproteum_vivax@DN4897_c0_g1_i1.p1